MVLEAKYPFIQDNVFLIARVYEHDNEEIYEDYQDEVNYTPINNDHDLDWSIYGGKQELIMQKVDSESGKIEFQSKITCIHSAVMNIIGEEFVEFEEDLDIQAEILKKALNIISSENLEEINLSIGEKFKAFKSWVAGIAEAGLDAFQLQEEIDENLDLMYPISLFLFKFMVVIDVSFIPLFLTKIEKDCVFNGKVHKASLRANLKHLEAAIILEYNNSDIAIHPQYCEFSPQANTKKILPQILKLDPDFLFESENAFVRQALAASIDATNYEQYKKFFETEPSSFYKEKFSLFQKYPFLLTQKNIAMNPGAPKFEGYRKYLHANEALKRLVAENPNAPLQEEYKILFKDESENVRMKAAANLMGAKFEEYKILFDDILSVRREVALNSEAVKLEGFRNLFNVEDLKIQINIASNPEAVKLEEFNRLRNNPSIEVIEALANNLAFQNMYFNEYKAICKNYGYIPLDLLRKYNKPIKIYYYYKSKINTYDLKSYRLNIDDFLYGKYMGKTFQCAIRMHYYNRPIYSDLIDSDFKIKKILLLGSELFLSDEMNITDKIFI